MNPLLRPASLEDRDELTRIAHAAKRHWGYPESWIEAWRRELTVEAEDMASLDFFLAEDPDGEVLGFAALGQEDDRAVLEHFWVDPSRMGGGVGRALFREALQRAGAVGALTLEIDSDPHAVDFYLHLGAAEVGSVDASMDGASRTRPQLRYHISYE